MLIKVNIYLIGDQLNGKVWWWFKLTRNSEGNWKNCWGILGDEDNTMHRSHHHMWLSDPVKCLEAGE